MRIHVVSFQVPYPANYGGVIDVYYKLRALYEMGHDIVLHTFVYGDRQPQGVLEELCSEVFYYPRKTGWKKQWSLTPYTVASRCDGTLLEHLCEDDAPILFDGLHCCFFLTHPRLAERMKAVRMHNVEHIYYEQLMHQGGFSWKWLYYWVESRRLRRFERCLSHADIVYAITKADALQLNSMLPQTKVVHMP